MYRKISAVIMALQGVAGGDRHPKILPEKRENFRFSQFLKTLPATLLTLNHYSYSETYNFTWLTKYSKGVKNIFYSMNSIHNLNILKVHTERMYNLWYIRFFKIYLQWTLQLHFINKNLWYSHSKGRFTYVERVYIQERTKSEYELL